MITGHGDDGYQYSSIKANFSSNVYQQLDLLELKHYLADHLSVIHHYPEPDAHSLVALLAEQKNLALDQLSITNGATEAIYLIAQAFAGKKTAILAPVFCEYADACYVHKHQVEHFFALEDFKGQADLCWICNPNNPTGELYAKDDLLALIKTYPQTCFVIDQSYIDFAPQALLTLAELTSYPHVILLHSMTKSFAIAGLRLGYLIAHRDLIKRINHFRMPWSVNSLAIVAGHYLVTHKHSLQIDLVKLTAETKELQQQLKAFDALKVLPSQMHYFLVQLVNGYTATELKNYLATEHHLLIRDASNFVGLDKHYFRVASQTPLQNSWLVEAINTALAEGIR